MLSHSPFYFFTTLYVFFIIIISSSSSSSSIQPLCLFGRNQSTVRRPVWLWNAAFLGTFLGVVFHCFPLPLYVPTFAARCLHVPINASAPSSERWNCVVILPKWRLFTPFRDLLHAENLRHGANGFTSLPKEGMPEKSDGFGRERSRDLGYQRPAC
jgi:hypothetical protein